MDRDYIFADFVEKIELTFLISMLIYNPVTMFSIQWGQIQVDWK